MYVDNLQFSYVNKYLLCLVKSAYTFLVTGHTPSTIVQREFVFLSFDCGTVTLDDLCDPEKPWNAVHSYKRQRYCGNQE